MSSIHLPKAVGQRGKTSLEIDRENFEKRQTVALNKAINSQESPVKEKHARNAILGTFQDQGGTMFWTIASKMPVQANPIVCWKFLQMVHKIMRDGHANVVRHSVRYQAQIHDLGKLWGHLKEGYGKLISSYCKLIVQKLKFHDKFRGIPGNLMMTDEQYYKICGADVNNYFEFSIDMLDYTDDILALQHAVFGSLDMSRANSMTTSGQCRLAPLILCILDSCQLYDYLVKSLFHLHSSLPPDTLFGHRDRFLVCYKKLKDFYIKCSNLQYFKHLVQVPHLPDDPPNFLIASDFTKHVKPAAVVREEEPEQEPEVEEVVENLIDMSMPEASAEQAAPPVPEVDERDFLIERLQREIRLLKEELGRVRAEDHRIITGLKEDISKLEKILSELRLSADKSFKENEELKKNLDPLKTDAESAEKHAKANQEKFQKMKEIYSKLRDEHVVLLRNHDTNTKQLSALKKSLEEKDQVLKESQLEVNRMVEEKQMVQDNLQKSADDVTQQLAEVSSFNTKLEKQKEVSGLDYFYEGWQKSQDLESRLQTLEESQTQLETDLATRTSDLHDMSTQLREARDAAAEREAELTEVRDNLQGELDQSTTERANLESRLEAQLAELRDKLAETEVSKDCLEADLTGKISTLSERCSQLETDKTEMLDQIRRLLDQTMDESIKMIQDAVEQGDNPAHSASTCTAEYLLARANTVLEMLNKGQELGDLSQDIQSMEAAVSVATGFSYHLSECIVQGFATSHVAQIEPGEELATECRVAGKAGIVWLQNLKNGTNSPSDREEVEASIQRLMKHGDGLLPKMEDVKAEEIGDLLENEMAGMTSAIEAAAAKIQDMLHKTREDNTGVDLEVNENILGSCTDLMKAIKVLVEKSRDLQREIIVSGRGTTSVADFYKKNHRWTEGLLSAAKAVGWGATTLLDTADRVVRGQGKFEEIMACAHEIAASTAQLVVSSKVKADRGSKLLGELGAASKGVNQATGNVVASAKAAAQIVEDQNLMDFSSMSLHQTKKMEMQCQIRVMELECNLEKERRNLGELRKQHYTLAGEAEGWEVNEDGEEISPDNTLDEGSLDGTDKK